MASAWTDLFSDESAKPVVRIECEELVEKEFLPELVKGLTLLTAWYNRRFDLAEGTQVEPTDWKMVSYDNSYGDWSLTAMHKDISNHYFLVEYESEGHATTITQYKQVVQETISDSDLNGDDEIESLTKSGQVIDITERLPNGQ